MVVNLGTELDAIELDDSGTFKTIVSGEPIEARPIRLAPFTMATSCKLWFLANNLPRFKHGTEAELRRMRFIRFNRKPVEKDVRLKDKLALERDGIFRWMVEGLLTLLTLREIPQGGKESKDVHARFHVSNDPVGTFVRERCELGPYETLKELMKAEYADYCEDNNLRAGAAEWFLRVLYERFTSVREVKRGPAGGQQRYLTGIRLRISG